VEAGVIHDLFNPQHETLGVRLGSLTSTRREVIKAIAEQIGFKTSIFHCGNGATILFGSGVGPIMVSDSLTDEPPTRAEPLTGVAADARGDSTNTTSTR
jgi:hypothetical protein